MMIKFVLVGAVCVYGYYFIYLEQHCTKYPLIDKVVILQNHKNIKMLSGVIYVG